MHGAALFSAFNIKPFNDFGKPTMCPPGTDQTERGHQWWTLMAPVLKQKHILPVGHWTGWSCNLDTFLQSNRTFGAFEKLASSGTNSRARSSSQADEETTPQWPVATSALESVPPEIFDMLLSTDILGETDILALGLSSKFLWHAVLAHVQSVYRRCTGTWANTPLICTGTYLTGFPTRLYELLPDLKADQEVWDRKAGNREPWRGTRPVREWNWGALSLFNEVGGVYVKQQWLDAFEERVEAVGGKNVDVSALRRELYGALQLPGQRVGAKWVLRDHDSKEVIRLEMVDDGKGDVYAVVADTAWLTLDTALLLRVYWTGSIDNDMDYGDWSKQGARAAHSFDVVPIEVAFDLTEQCDWKDVTRKAVHDAKELGYPHCAPDLRTAIGCTQPWKNEGLIGSPATKDATKASG